MDAITISDLLHLSVAERLQLAEYIWDRIAAESADSPEAALDVHRTSVQTRKSEL